MGRIPIGGTDFSTRSYSYDDSDAPDLNLTHWSLADEDIDLKIPYIKEALGLAQKRGVQLKLFGSPWSPPKWMKNSNSFVRGSLIDDNKVYQSYSEYLVRFLKAYESHEINLFGMTCQNEPFACQMPFYFFNSLQFNSKQMIKFIGHFLGPTLAAHNYTRENFKLMVGDDSLGFINNYVPTIMKDKEVQKYISGLAFHWYTSGVIPYSALTDVYDAVKDKIEFMIMSEACCGSMPLEKKVDPGSWDRAEAYAEDIIEDLNRMTSAWIDWNICLDLKTGGPNWSKNFVDSPILVDSKNRRFLKNPMYYALGHFSRFFKEGSVRVSTKVTKGKRGLLAVAVHNKESGHLIINILNKSDDSRSTEVIINGSDDNSIEDYRLETTTFPPKSLSTVVLKL